MNNVAIRKVVEYTEVTFVEGGRAAPTPVKMAACAAVLQNPWAGSVFTEDLQPQILVHAKVLAEALVPPLLKLVGGAEKIEAYGKSAVVGTSGEIEHAAGLIHTLYFGNAFRVGAAGDAFLPFTNKRGSTGTAITVPMTHKDEKKKGTRSHFLTLEFSISDAPAADEIIVAIGAATGGRPHHRIGDRFLDMKIMGVDQTGRPL
ncbi:amino acid synthesis family protein [Ochrobactrum teleogrylli]